MSEIATPSTHQDLVVSKSDQLIRKAKHELTAKELTLVDYLISKIAPSDRELFEVNTTLEIINSECKFGDGGGSNFKNTEEALLNLTNKGFYLKLTDGWKTTARWLDKATIKEGHCRLQLDSDLAPYLLNLSQHYTQYYFKDVVNLKSIYAKRLYELLRSYSPSESVEVPVNEIISLFNKDKIEWYRVMNYVRKAVKDISHFTTMTVSYETIKSGRSTVAIRFFLDMKKVDLI